MDTKSSFLRKRNAARPEASVSQGALFRGRLDSIIDMRHELVRLVRVIHRDALDEQFGQVWSDKGRPAIPTRIMVGMAYLQATDGLSDPAAVAKWVVNPYWQYFGGEAWFQHKPPIDRSSMSCWRKRIQEQGLETRGGDPRPAGQSLRRSPPLRMSWRRSVA